jgi:hypothetical protein
MAYYSPEVAIQAYCYTESDSVNVSITMDGSPTGYDTPHTFVGLTGTHTFTVPIVDPNGHSFSQWNTGETSTTITVTSPGIYIAYYSPEVAIQAYCYTESDSVNVSTCRLLTQTDTHSANGTQVKQAPP